MGLLADQVVNAGPGGGCPGAGALGVLFPGQGAQAVGMGQDACRDVPGARALFERADTLLGFSVSEICFSGPLEALTETRLAQPALFVASLALFEALRARRPELVSRLRAAAGLSLGEFTALAAAGSLSFEEGLRLVQIRAEAMQRAAEAVRGGMVSVIGLSLEACRGVAREADVDVANINAADQVVLSGRVDALERVGELACSQGAKRVVALAVSGAFHSRLMKPAEEALAGAVERTSFRRPAFAVVSNVTGKAMWEAAEMRQNLVRQLSSSVDWVSCMQTLARQGISACLEVGPGRVLKGLAKRIVPDLPVHGVGTLEELQRLAVEERA